MKWTPEKRRVIARELPLEIHWFTRYSPELRLTETVAAVMIIKGLRAHSAKTGSIELRLADLDAADRAYIRRVTEPR